MAKRRYTSQELEIINTFKRENPHICYYCGKEITNNNHLTVDHKTPVCKGGKTVKENLAISCLKCNREKSDMTEEVYDRYKQTKDYMKTFEVTEALNQLIDLHNSIIQRIMEVNKQFCEKNEQITELQQEIMNTNFNACEGFMYAKQLKGLLKEQTELTLIKDNYNKIWNMLGTHRKQLCDVKQSMLKDIIEPEDNVIEMKNVI